MIEYVKTVSFFIVDLMKLTTLKCEKLFCVCIKNLIQKSFGKEHVDCVDQYNIHFAISHTKTEFSLCHSMPFFDDEIHKITFILNNLFKITSLDREG